MTLIDGKKISQDIKASLTKEVEALKDQGGRAPHLVAVLVGDDGASHTYVNSKIRSCERVGFRSSLLRFPETVSEEEIIKTVENLNNDPDTDGFIVQLPLPKHLSEENILLSINPDKDIDGFHPCNFGRMAQGLPSFIPATPYGILRLIDAYKIPTSGRHVVVVGRSNIVGRPISVLLSQKGYDATVTITHSRTKNIDEILRDADIIIMALGQPEFLKADMVKEKSVIIDVGITRQNCNLSPKGYRIVGDVDFEQVSKKASFITPVPGGVGPMTIAMLMENTLRAYKNNINV